MLRLDSPPNGSRYRRLGGLRQSLFAGIHLELRKVLENAQTPRRRVHALLGDDSVTSLTATNMIP